MKQIINSVIQKILSRSPLGVSGAYFIISKTQAQSLQLEKQWQDTSLPEKQYQIVRAELEKINRTGKFPPHMQALIDQLRLLNLTNPTLLEIGCSSGYYNEIIRQAGLSVQYHGCDYSGAFIKFARQLYPTIPFQVEDNTHLSYRDNQFDIVVSGCCILHILNYAKAIAETARVAKRFVIFHRTPVVHLRPTTYMQKKGYGLDMVEIFFSETELFELFRMHRLAVISSITFAQESFTPDVDEIVLIKTFLCKKI